jgi:hypothetical protein
MKKEKITFVTKGDGAKGAKPGVRTVSNKSKSQQK